MDGAFGLIQGVLLQLAVPADNRAAPTLGRLVSHLWGWMAAGFAKPAVRVCLAIVLVLVGASGYTLWYHLARAEPDISYSSVEDHFKYGAIGLGADSRVPYWIWKVLPDMFPEYLPGSGGWASLGLIYEDGQ